MSSQDLSAAPPPPRNPPPSEGAGGGWGAPSNRTGGDSPWAASHRPSGERVTTRLRRVVEGLPDWEPLPPGETVVRRPGSLS
ncbi:hypothetical protein [Streptomyces sp. NPDC021622]|uniref:hypothetical protein n=1 Tax=Streptomyces sp. NPDC021622 TaxID=3155013 RepID=UPI0033C6BB93